MPIKNITFVEITDNFKDESSCIFFINRDTASIKLYLEITNGKT